MGRGPPVAGGGGGSGVVVEVIQGVEEPTWVVHVEWDSVEGHEQGFGAPSDGRSA